MPNIVALYRVAMVVWHQHSIEGQCNNHTGPELRVSAKPQWSPCKNIRSPPTHHGGELGLVAGWATEEVRDATAACRRGRLLVQDQVPVDGRLLVQARHLKEGGEVEWRCIADTHTG